LWRVEKDEIEVNSVFKFDIRSYELLDLPRPRRDRARRSLGLLSIVDRLHIRLFKDSNVLPACTDLLNSDASFFCRSKPFLLAVEAILCGCCCTCCFCCSSAAAERLLCFELLLKLECRDLPSSSVSLLRLSTPFLLIVEVTRCCCCCFFCSNLLLGDSFVGTSYSYQNAEIYSILKCRSYVAPDCFF